jgi:anhydro-N-acetylmuramic acid kinase
VIESPPFVGLISGTSRDGVDAALVEFDGDRPDLRAALCLPYPDDLARRLEAMVRTAARPREDEMAPLDIALASHFAEAVARLLAAAETDPADVVAIGSHGQTVWHDPDGRRPESIQLGDPARIARLTGVTTVGDFRRADIEAGGQGAPLAPLLHRALFRPASGEASDSVAVVNLGGIANVSLIGGDGSVIGFDTGPANCLMDAWIRTQKEEVMDRDGAWAASGRTDHGLLDDLLADPWFARSPPKSTGIEYFNLPWLEAVMGNVDRAANDVQATLAELTAVSVSNAIRPARPSRVLVCGGGVHNMDLMRRMRERLTGIELASTAADGLDPDWVEAVLFAWLARERLAGRPLDTSRITGAHQPVLLGAIHRSNRPASDPALE